MYCPQCGASVAPTQSECPQCLLDLSILQALQELRHAMRCTQADSQSIADRILELEGRLSSLEPLVVSKLPVKANELPPEDIIDTEEPSGPPPSSAKEDAQPQPQAGYQTHRDRQPESIKQTGIFSSESELQFGQRWLLIIGIIITVLAVGYFLKYSFDQNWIGPAGRVLMAYGAGFITLAIGEWLRRRAFAVLGLYLFGGGIAVLYFACYAAFQIYDLISQPIAFALMVLVTGLAGACALIFDTKWLAVLGIIGGFVTPIVLSTGTDNQIALMTYMLILNAGVLAIATFKQWRLLNALGLGFTWLLFTGWFLKYYADDRFWITTFYLNAFFLAYALVPFVYYFVRQSREKVIGFALTIPNAFISFGYAFFTIREHFRLEAVSIAAVAYALLFFAMARYLVRRNPQNREALVLLIAKGTFFLVITVPILFSEQWITVFWAIQGLVLMWASMRLGEKRLAFGAIGMLLIATCKLFLMDYPFAFDLRFPRLAISGGFEHLLVERWVTVAVTLAALPVAGRMLRAHPQLRAGIPRAGLRFFSTLFGITLFIALNLEVAAFFHDFAPRARFAAISVLWALFASACMVLGFIRNRVELRRVAIGLFAVTVLKVFIRDMANVETPYRILSFLIVGVLLVVASYLYHRYSGQILAATSDRSPDSSS